MRKRTFWHRLQEAMQDNGIKPTQKAAAALVGVSQPSVNKWAKGKLPILEHVTILATKLGVCVDWLLTERGEKHPLDAESAALLNAYHALPSSRLKERALAYIEGLAGRGPETTPVTQIRPRPRLS